MGLRHGNNFGNPEAERLRMKRTLAVLVLATLLIPTVTFGQGEEEYPPKPIGIDGTDDSASPNKVNELLEEITGNMGAIEKLLNERKTGEGMQAHQEKVIKKIEELITEMNKT